MPGETTTTPPSSSVTILKDRTAYVVQIEVLKGTGEWVACAPPVQAPGGALAFRLRVEESPAGSEDGKIGPAVESPTWQDLLFSGYLLEEIDNAIEEEGRWTGEKLSKAAWVRRACREMLDWLAEHRVRQGTEADLRDRAATKVRIIDSPRPNPEDEDRVLLLAFRNALERCADALGLPGSPSLVTAVPDAVEQLAKGAVFPRGSLAAGYRDAVRRLAKMIGQPAELAPSELPALVLKWRRKTAKEAREYAEILHEIWRIAGLPLGTDVEDIPDALRERLGDSRGSQRLDEIAGDFAVRPGREVPATNVDVFSSAASIAKLLETIAAELSTIRIALERQG
jgi:hypothetical protein